MNRAATKPCQQAYGRLQRKRLHRHSVDFENVSWTDRGALSIMVANVASEFHSAKLQLSIATVPNAPGCAPAKAIFQLDLRELAWRVRPGVARASVDLICLMTYDQHTRWTAPVPLPDGRGPPCNSITL